MFSAIKKITVAALVLAVLTPALTQARVQHIHKYKRDELKSFDNKDNHKQGGVSQKEEGIPCGSYGWYTQSEANKVLGTAAPNAACEKMQLSDRVCYKCKCPDTYQYVCTYINNGKELNKVGIKPAGSRCHLKDTDTVLYTGCACDEAQRYLPAEKFNLKAYGLFGSGTSASVQGSNGGAGITCYNADSFVQCASGSNTTIEQNEVNGSPSGTNVEALTIKVINETGIEYTARALLDTPSKSITAGKEKFNNKYCATAASISLPLLSSAPTADEYKCITYTSATAKHYPSVMYYHPIDCVQGGDCVKNTDIASECIKYQSKDVTKLNGSKLTCKRVLGCETGVPEGKNFLCGEASLSPMVGTQKVFAMSSVSSGGVSCKKVTGCENPYTKRYLATNPPKDSYSEDSDYVYTVHKLTSGTGTVVCTVPSGCPTGKYDYACPTGCWGGWLSLWAKAAGK